MKIRRHLKKLAVTMLVIFLNQILFPTYSLALTGGPTQPEVHGFEPAGTNQMVDLFSGDFTYNIPLFDIGGYPINMAYHSGVSMEQEASWVGLGWSLTPGAITRNMRGLPDDFKGEEVSFMRKMKANKTIGLDLGVDIEVVGLELKKLHSQAEGKSYLKRSRGVRYNNYTGVSLTNSVGLVGSDKDGNIMESPIIGYSNDGGLSINAKPGLGGLQKATNSLAKSGSLLGKALTALTPTTGEISWNSSQGLEMSASGPEWSKGKASVKSKMNILTSEKVYSPGSDASMWNFGASLRATLGTEAFGVDGQYEGNFSYNLQKLGKGGDVERDGDVATWNLKAYGVEYGDAASGDFADDLLDVNRDHEYSLRDESPLLPVTQLTYDIFSISGQGTGGSFRSYRNDYPMVGKNRVSNVPLADLHLGLELGGTNLVKLGGNSSITFSESRNGFWSKNADDVTSKIGFDSRENDAAGDWLYEPKYFKKGGEFGLVDAGYLSAIGNEEAVRFDLSSTRKLDNELKNTSSSFGELSNKSHSLERAKRGSAILAHTKFEASQYGFVQGLDKDKASSNYGGQYIPNHHERNHTDALDHTGYAKVQKIDRREEMPGEDHHYGEFQILQNNGFTYVYGLPVYNNQTVEASFAIAAPNSSPNNSQDQGYVDYNSSTDPTAKNENGRDHFVSKKEVPGYAHSFLLTAILSPDYTDLTGDGVTDDDLGEAVIFNYEKVHENYGWRNPVAGAADKARYIEGLRTEGYDDKASYVYGTKEIWFLQSIESGNMVAEFVTSDRKDALGVADEAGNIATEQKQKKLEKIILYNKMDRIQEDAERKPTPIKTIYFDYDYSLCKGVPNHNNAAPNDGKLTLKKLSFSYGNSGTGLLSPYEFEYHDQYTVGDNTQDYKYNPLNVDRWGNYMEYDDNKPNTEFPYTKQDKNLTDQYAKAWLLKKIILPSDGEINIDYESDDYAHVMEKRAMIMQNIAGIGRTKEFTKGNKLYQLAGGDNNFVYFELPDPNYTDADIAKYVSPGQSLYFKCLFHVKDNEGASSDDKEYVSGFAKIKDIGRCTVHDPQDPTKKYGFIELEEKREGNLKYQAMSVAAWKFFLAAIPDRIQGRLDAPDDLLKEGKDFLLSRLGKIAQIVKGNMGKMKAERYGQFIDLSKSIIRLKEHTGFKLGGGSRVKQITMSDNWDAMSGETKGEYGSVYEYTTVDGSMSSGVAANEPAIGNEENPYKEPIYFQYRPKSFFGLAKVGTEQEDYVIGPFGEMFFPSSGVGYSNIKVKTLATKRMEENQISGSPTGYTLHQFYTAKDFPVIEKKTIPKAKNNNPVSNTVWSLLGVKKRDLAMAQGYSFILNDMHGKPRMTTSFNQNGDLMTSQEYYYNADGKKLINDVAVLNRADGSISGGKIGVEVDFVADAHESINRTYQLNFQPNVAVTTFGLPPFVALPSLWFGFNSSTSNLRYASNTKVIYKYGILDRVISRDQTSNVIAENVLWDAETGQVLLSRTWNEYNDQVENLSLPAHFAYSGMRGAYENLDIRINDVSISEGVYNMPSGKDATQFFEPGDEIILSKKGGVKKAWVLQVFADKIYLIDAGGLEIEGSYSYMRIVRSGKRNQTGAPVLVVSSNGDLTTQLGNKNINDVLNISTAEFSDQWGTYCGRLAEQVCTVTDDLAIVLNCLWNKANGSYNNDFDLDLDRECQGTNLTSNIRNQARAISEMNVLKKEGEEVTFQLYVVEFSGPERYEAEGALTDLDVKIEAIEHGASTSTYYTRSTFHPDFNAVVTYLDNLNGTTNSYTVTSGPMEDVRLLNAKTVSYKYSKPSFMFLQDATVGSASEILIGVGATGTYDYNPSLPWYNQTPTEVACVLKLIPIGVPTISRADIATFTGMSKVGDDYVLHAEDALGNPIDLKVESPCLDLTWCEMAYACTPTIDQRVVNPYLQGIRGNWRAKNNYTFHTTRSNSVASTDKTNIRVDGELENFSLPLYETPGVPFSISGDRWISPATATVYTPNGNQIESQDALGRYSTEIFGYDQRMVIAAANNAPHHNIAFDGFEEYTYLYHQDCRKELHWAMSEYVGVTQATSSLSNNYHYDNISDWKEVHEGDAHTGNYCVKLDAGDVLTTEDVVKNTCTPYTQQDLDPFKLSDCDCIGSFEPDADEQYFFSAWIKEDHSSQPSTYQESRIKVSVLDDQQNVLSTTTISPKGAIIEGWQRAEGTFSIPSGSGLSLRVSFEADASLGAGNAAYLDDVRIQPFNSQMNSYVYHPDNLRLMAELDENNYATFYEYDEEGRLLRIKKETERGIVTLQESRYGIAN